MNCLTRLLGIDKQLEAIRKTQAEQDGKLDKILAAVSPLPAVGFIFTSNLEGEIIEGATATTMKNSQKLTLSIQPVDKNGNPAELGSVPAWAINDSTLASLTPTGDGLNCELAGIGPSGTTKVVVSADADLGEGVKPIFGEYELTVTPGDAVGFKITASEPVDQ